jgi:Zn ribbon nucleic-acid-binding protein
LCPVDPDCPAIDSAVLTDRLQAIGLAGNAVAVGTESIYPTGERFLQLVSFLGCSPAIELDLPDDPVERMAACAAGQACHIRISQSGSQPRFRADSRRAAARCPACRQPVADWETRIAAWRSNPADSGWHCSHCAHEGRVFDLNFRKSAGFGHTFIEIWGIHPSEAVPVTTLLDALENISRCKWKTLYVKD